MAQMRCEVMVYGLCDKKRCNERDERALYTCDEPTLKFSFLRRRSIRKKRSRGNIWLYGNLAYTEDPNEDLKYPHGTHATLQCPSGFCCGGVSFKNFIQKLNFH